MIRKPSHDPVPAAAASPAARAAPASTPAARRDDVASPSSEVRIRTVGVATLIAGLLPLRIEPGRVVSPWSAEALRSAAEFWQVLAPTITGTSLIVVAGLYGKRRLRPPFGALAVLALWAVTIAAIGSSAWMMRTLVGGPFSQIDSMPLLVMLSLSAAATGLEIRRLPGSEALGRRLWPLALILLLSTYLLPTPSGLVAQDVAAAWGAIFTMPAAAAMSALPFRLADLAPFGAALGLLWTARRGEFRWSMHLVLHGLAACVALGGLPLVLLYGDTMGALAWLRSGLLCAATVEGIQWSLVREAKAVASVSSRRRTVFAATAAIAIAAVGVGWLLSWPQSFEPRQFTTPTDELDEAMAEALPDLFDSVAVKGAADGTLGVEGEGETAAPPPELALVPLLQDARLAKALTPLIARAAQPTAQPDRWKSQIADFNHALRALALPYHLDLDWRTVDGSPPSSERPQRAHVRVYRLERAYLHPRLDGPFEVVVGHQTAGSRSPNLEVGRVHAGARLALVDRGVIAWQANRRALSLVADRSCGSVLSAPGLDRACGAYLLAALNASPSDRRLDPVERTAAALETALLRVTTRHEMQHQLDASAYRIPARIWQLAPDGPPNTLVRLTLETSAQLAEYCTPNRLEQATALAELLAHVWDTSDPTPDRLAAIATLEILTDIELHPLMADPKPEHVAALLDAFYASQPTDIAQRAATRHVEHFGTPCAAVPEPIAAADETPGASL